MQFRISQENTAVFRQALQDLTDAEVPFAIGGAFAMFQYSGVWRNTNDLDLYLERKWVPKAISLLLSRGFRDIGEMAAGDREWIFHAVKDDTMVDLIWQPPNSLWSVDNGFYEDALQAEFLNVPVRFLSADRLICTKIFTMNRHRCDWPDVFGIVRSCSDKLNWARVLQLVGDHWQVLLSFIVLFQWVYPSEADNIPQHVYDDLAARKTTLHPAPDTPTRESVLDPWIYTRPISP